MTFASIHPKAGAKFALLAIVLVMMVAVTTVGQQNAGTVDQNSNPNTGTTAQAPGTQPPPPPPPRMYAGALFGTQPIAVDVWQPAPAMMDAAGAPPVAAIAPVEPDNGLTFTNRQPSRYYLISGFTGTASYEQVGGGGSQNQSVGFLSPYAGILGRTRTGFWVLQYSPTIVPYSPFISGTQVYQRASFNAAGNLTRNVSWNLATTGGYGSEAGLMGATLPTQGVVSGVQIANPTAATILPFNGNVMNTTENANVAWAMSATKTLTLNLAHNYFGFSSNPGNILLPSSHSNSGHTGLDFGQQLSARTTLHLYGTADKIFATNMPQCLFYGGGAGLSYAATKTIALSAGGGPTNSSANCGRGMGGNFYATLTASLPYRMTAYVSSQRTVMTAFRTNSVWEDNVTAGVARSLRMVSLGFDGGYYHGQPLAAGLPSTGYFLSPRVDYGLKVANNVRIGAGYRRYHTSVPLFNGVGGDIGYFFGSLTFSPNPIPLQK